MSAAPNPPPPPDNPAAPPPPQQPATSTPNPKLKKLLAGIWLDANGGPGPAKWRTSQYGPVRGLARNKGVKSPLKIGFDIEERGLKHPCFKGHTALPSAKLKPKDPVVAAAGDAPDGARAGEGEEKEKKRKLCVVM